MSGDRVMDLFIITVPFVLYTALLAKLFVAWKTVRVMEDRCKESRLAAILLLITVCTLTFMAANIYVLQVYGKTLLSMKFFQMFVLSNCAVYWLVLDLITKDACSPES